jgi:Uma2 family endonuclease
MAIAESESPLQPFEVCTRLFTAADLEELPTDLPPGPIAYEFDNGRLVFITLPPSDLHGAAQANIGTQLQIQGELQGYGKARASVAVILWRNPDRVVTSDAVFVAKKSLPIRTSAEDYLETIPELVVEIRSKNGSLEYAERKVKHYLKAGAEIVWVADWSARTLTAHTGAGEPTVYGESDTLRLPGLIPDFSMPVVDVFRE